MQASVAHAGRAEHAMAAGHVPSRLSGLSPAKRCRALNPGHPSVDPVRKVRCVDHAVRAARVDRNAQVAVRNREPPRFSLGADRVAIARHVLLKPCRNCACRSKHGHSKTNSTRVSHR